MKLSLKQLLGIAGVILGVLAIVLLFAPVLKVNVLGFKDSFNGFDVYFGKEDDLFKASAGGIITFVLLVVVLCASILKFCLPKYIKILNFCIIVCGVLAAIFLFMGCTSFMVNIKNYDFDDVKDYCDLGVGAIMSAIFALCAAAVACFDEFFVKK